MVEPVATLSAVQLDSIRLGLTTAEQELRVNAEPSHPLPAALEALREINNGFAWLRDAKDEEERGDILDWMEWWALKGLGDI